MKFYSAEDIENLAAQGKKELILDANTALTDLARDTARQLGITLVDGSRPAPVSARAAPPTVRESPVPSTQLGPKPTGCQHGPLSQTNQPEQPSTGNVSSPLVDRLVGMVKQIGKRPGNGSVA